MSFDLDRALRALKSQRKLRKLAGRGRRELPWIDQVPAAGGPVLLDTTVYIDTLQGRSPPALDRLISLRICNHSAVCVAELTHAFGRLDPADARTAPALSAIAETIRDIPTHRLFVPDADVWGTAGILAGLMFRLGDYPSRAERKCLNDALVCLQARKLGCAVLTGNVRDFEILDRLVPHGRVLLYRREARG